MLASEDRGSETAGLNSREARTFPSLGWAVVATILVTFAILMGAAEVDMLALLVASIKSAFKLSDAAFGAVQGVGPNLLSLFVYLPVGMIVDRSNRMRLLAIALSGLTVFAALTGLCSQTWELTLCRSGIGVAQACLVPASYSIVADLFPQRQRARALFLFYAGIELGTSLAYSLGGTLVGAVERYGAQLPLGLADMEKWRVTLFTAAVPAGLLAAIVFVTKEPVRQENRMSAGGAREGGSLMGYLKENWALVVLFMAGLGFARFGYDVLMIWAPAILTRKYAWSAAEAGQWLGFTIGLGQIAGIAIAGLTSGLLEAGSGPMAAVRVLRLGLWATAAAVIGYWFVQDATQFLLVTGLYFAFLFIGLSLGPMLLMTMAPGQLRGRLFAMYMIIVVGPTVFAPVLVGRLADSIADAQGGILFAFRAIATPVVVIAPFLILLCRWELFGDRARS